MATVFYMPAGLIPNDTGSEPATTIMYAPAGGPPTDTVAAGGVAPLVNESLVNGLLIDGSLVS